MNKINQMNEAKRNFALQEINVVNLAPKILARFDTDREVRDYMDQLQQEVTLMLNSRRRKRLEEMKL